MRRKEKTKPYAILHNYEFDGVQIPSAKTTASLQSIRSLIESTRQYPEEECLFVKNKFKLDKLPELHIVVYDPPVKTDDYLLAAEYNYKTTTQVVQPRMRLTSKLMLFTSFWSIIGIILLGAVFGRQPETNDCTIQILNGKPHSIVIDTTEYKLQPDGTMSKETRTFLNPWHKQFIESGQCKQVEL